MQQWWLSCMEAAAHKKTDSACDVLSLCSMSVGFLRPQAAHASVVYPCRLDVMRSSTLPPGLAKRLPTWLPWCTIYRWAPPHLKGHEFDAQGAAMLCCNFQQILHPNQCVSDYLRGESLGWQGASTQSAP